MTAPLTRSKPRRRRIIAAILFLLLGACAWLLFPRTDPRFVGEWDFLEEKQTSGDLRIDLGRWGRARLYDTNGEFVVISTWLVSGGKLRIGNESVGLMKQMLEILEQNLATLTGTDYQLASSDSISIAEVTPDVIHLYDDAIVRESGQASLERLRFQLVRRKK